MNTFRKEIPTFVILPYANLNAITPPLGVYPDGQARRRERRSHQKHKRNTKR